MRFLYNIGILFIFLFPFVLISGYRRACRDAATQLSQLIYMAHRGERLPRWHTYDLNMLTRDILCVPLTVTQLQQIRACSSIERYDVMCKPVKSRLGFSKRYVILSVSVDFSGHITGRNGDELQGFTLNIKDCLVKFSLQGSAIQPPEIMSCLEE